METKYHHNNSKDVFYFTVGPKKIKKHILRSIIFF